MFSHESDSSSKSNSNQGFWGGVFGRVVDSIFSVKKTIGLKIKRVLEFLGISGVTDGFTYGSFGWVIGGEVGVWLGSETLFFPFLFALGGAFSAGIFGINNVHREYKSLAYPAPNRLLRKGENGRRFSRALGSSVALVAMIPFTGMAMSAFAKWPASTFFVVWHSINRFLMNDQALRVLVDELVDFICVSYSSAQTRQNREELLRAVELGCRKMLASSQLDDFQKESSPEEKIKILFRLSKAESGALPSSRSSRFPLFFGSVGFGLGAGTGLYLYNFSYRATVAILNQFFELSCNEKELNIIAILGLIPTMVLWGEDTARVFYEFSDNLMRYFKKQASEKSEGVVTAFPRLRQHKWALLIPGSTAAISETLLSYNQASYLPSILNLFVRCCSPVSLLAVYCKNLFETDRKIFDAIEDSFLKKRGTSQRREFLSQTLVLRKTVAQLPNDMISSLHKTLLGLASSDSVRVVSAEDVEATPPQTSERTCLLRG